MDPIVIDILIEFLEVVTHNILFMSNIYPKEIFESRKKYTIPVKYSVHPQLNSYIVNCLRSARELLLRESLERVEISFFSDTRVELQKFVFNIDYKQIQNMNTSDPYLIKFEQSLRKFCLKLGNLSSSFQVIPENSSFEILMHTNESASQDLAKNPDFEDFPLIEQETDSSCGDINILPLSCITLDGITVESYIENKGR